MHHARSTFMGGIGAAIGAPWNVGEQECDAAPDVDADDSVAQRRDRFLDGAGMTALRCGVQEQRRRQIAGKPLVAKGHRFAQIRLDARGIELHDGKQRAEGLGMQQRLARIRGGDLDDRARGAGGVLPAEAAKRRRVHA